MNSGPGTKFLLCFKALPSLILVHCMNGRFHRSGVKTLVLVEVLLLKKERGGACWSSIGIS